MSALDNYADHWMRCCLSLLGWSGLRCLCWPDIEGSVPVPLMTLCSSPTNGIIDSVSPAPWEGACTCKMDKNLIKFSDIDSDKPLLIAMLCEIRYSLTKKISQLFDVMKACWRLPVAGSFCWHHEDAAEAFCFCQLWIMNPDSNKSLSGTVFLPSFATRSSWNDRIWVFPANISLTHMFSRLSALCLLPWF